ncbi:hypothetical protein RB628_03670 [Streptomyces sp. ADMS]|uniref:hypothetical protein n=1 Tax=Streptomyces sp. ADMS TaxID=3071415 RepID=UPI00296EF905|nr:hypothetical protein [Streptomyces sp. ADMS]MDW4904459.1 hypothetical protein [Streptomyces sp. ADMS]
MIRTHERAKGGAPQLGARRSYERGPFGVRPREDDDQGDELPAATVAGQPTEGEPTP